MNDDECQALRKKAPFWNVTAQATIATAERQKVCGLNPGEAPLSQDTVLLAQMVGTLVEVVGKLGFELDAATGKLPGMELATKLPHEAIIGPNEPAPSEDAARFYGYQGAAYHVLIGSTSHLEAGLLNGDLDTVCSAMSRLRARASEIMDLRVENRKLLERIATVQPPQEAPAENEGAPFRP